MPSIVYFYVVTGYDSGFRLLLIRINPLQDCVWSLLVLLNFLDVLVSIVSLWVLRQPSLVLETISTWLELYLLHHLCLLVICHKFTSKKGSLPLGWKACVQIYRYFCSCSSDWHEVSYSLNDSQTRRGLSMDNTGKALGNLHIGTLFTLSSSKTNMVLQIWKI